MNLRTAARSALVEMAQAPAVGLAGDDVNIHRARRCEQREDEKGADKKSDHAAMLRSALRGRELKSFVANSLRGFAVSFRMSHIATHRWQLNRRHALRGIGATLALPFLDCYLNGNGTAQAATGAPLPVRYGARREGDPAGIVAGAERVRRVLGWKPQHQDLDFIVRTALDWERKLMQRNAA